MTYIITKTRWKARKFANYFLHPTEDRKILFAPKQIDACGIFTYKDCIYLATRDVALNAALMNHLVGASVYGHHKFADEND